jgi:hypothetical protein
VRPARGSQAQLEIVSGRLRRVFGGETTGWALQVNTMLRTERFLDVEPANDRLALADLDNEWVEVEGTVQLRRGTHRGQYAVLRAHKVRKIEASGDNKQ